MTNVGRIQNRGFKVQQFNIDPQCTLKLRNYTPKRDSTVKFWKEAHMYYILLGKEAIPLNPVFRQ